MAGFLDTSPKCSRCQRRLTDKNCTLITGTCDDCLADQAADDRNNEMACEDSILLELDCSKPKLPSGELPWRIVDPRGGAS